LIVDEAFADADEGHSLLPHVARLDYSLVLRSVGKFYGAGGVRLGFAITSHPIAERLKAALGAWPISAQALARSRLPLPMKPGRRRRRTRLLPQPLANSARVLTKRAAACGGTALFRLVNHLEQNALRASRKPGHTHATFQGPQRVAAGLPAGPEAGRLREALQTAPRNEGA
jgi:cobalamin biosynthetic protein CobC